MSKIAFVFPGQGAQHTGMGMDLLEQSSLARSLFDQANEHLDFDLYELCANEDAPINQTAYTQPALLAVSICLLNELLSKTSIQPDYLAGLSLGEYTALVASKSLKFEDAIKFVRKRGLFMEEAGAMTKGGMAAVVKGDIETIHRYCLEDEGIVVVANYNSPVQVVLSGEEDAVRRVSKRLEEDNIRVIPLQVSGAFHSPLMESAAVKFEKELENIIFEAMETPYITNVTANEVIEIDEIKDLLVSQLKGSVQWEQSITYMINQGVDTFVEIGPGNTLAGLIKKINRKVTVLNVNTFESIDTVGAMLRGVCYA